MTKRRVRPLRTTITISIGILIAGATAADVCAQPAVEKPDAAKTVTIPETKPGDPAAHRSPPDSIAESSVTVGGQKIVYTAVAGTLTVGSTDAYDVMLGLDGLPLPDAGTNAPHPAKPDDAPATARMFYTAYFK
jgi:hypothetical protein